jgi:integrase
VNLTEQEQRGRWQKDRSDRGIYQRGKTWYIRFRDQGGKMRAERVGPSKTLALKAYQKRKTEVAERRFFPGANNSFDELIKDVIAEAKRNYALKKLNKRTTYRYRILGEWFKGRKASSLRPEEIDKKLSDHCVTPANFNRYRNSLSHAYRLAIQNGKATDNPARLIKLKQENNTRVRFLEPEEETALRAAIQNLDPPREPEFDLALYTGMRWSEQYGLTWTQVNWKLNEITLLHTKSGRKQYVRINKAARAALEKLRVITRGSDYVCPDQGHHAFDFWWREVLEKSKVKNFHWHDLRHTFASRLVMAGTDIYTVSKLLRHGSVKTTERYAHLADTHLQQAVECLTPGVTPSVTALKKPALHVPQSIQ